MCPWVFVFFQQIMEYRIPREDVPKSTESVSVCHRRDDIRSGCDQLAPRQLLLRWSLDRIAMLDQLRYVADRQGFGHRLNREGARSGPWCYPQGILGEICQYLRSWYSLRNANDIRIGDGALYLFEFERIDKVRGIAAADSVEFVLSTEDEQHRVAVFNWGLQHDDSVCINDRASGKEWKSGDLVHFKVDTRCDVGADSGGRLRLEFWITSNGTCSRNICVEIECKERPLSLTVNGGFAMKRGVQVC